MYIKKGVIFVITSFVSYIGLGLPRTKFSLPVRRTLVATATLVRFPRESRHVTHAVWLGVASALSWLIGLVCPISKYLLVVL